MGSGEKRKIGSFTGTGASKKISLAFQPRYVKVVNHTTLASAEKYSECEIAGAEGGIKTAIDGALSKLTAAQGIKFGEFEFEVGTDDAVNKAGDHIAFLAIE